VVTTGCTLGSALTLASKVSKVVAEDARFFNYSLLIRPVYTATKKVNV